MKDSPSPAESKDPTPSPYTSPRAVHKADASVPPTPSSLPPLPESPIKSIVQAIPKPNDVIAAVSAVQRRVVQQTQREILPHGSELLEATRAVCLIRPNPLPSESNSPFLLTVPLKLAKHLDPQLPL